MESIADLLGRKDFTPPDEVALAKEYIQRRYQSPSIVRVQNGNLVVTVRNSALAATIHLERQALIDAVGLGNKKLIIRTGAS